MDYVFDYIDMPGSQIDALCIDISNEGVAHYRSKILRPIQHPGLVKWRDEGIDYFDELIKQGHKRNKEIWWGLRMNEYERGDLAAYGGKKKNFGVNPVKADHPEWLIKAGWGTKGWWNYAVKDVREYRLSIIREVAEQYDFDGMHLDFLRRTPFLPPGKQWECRDHLTEFMYDVRQVLQEQAAKRNRPFLLAARVPDSLDGCHIDGLDIERWCALGLIDILVVGTRTINIDLGTFRKATAKANIKLIPSFDFHHGPDGYQGDQSLDLLCGVFGNYLNQGADGIGIFNTPAGSAEKAAKLRMRQVQNFDPAIIRAVGSLETIKGRSRYYPMDRKGGYPFVIGYGSSNANAPLPLIQACNGSASSLELFVWEKVRNTTSCHLRIVLYDYLDADTVTIHFNEQLLKCDVIDQGWKDKRIFSPIPQPGVMRFNHVLKDKDLAEQKLTRLDYGVPAGILNCGANSIRIVVESEDKTSRTVKVEKVELHLLEN